ncbi:MAG: hypothetical protein ACRC33_01145, partial [Gemmataceae bacterium]
GAEGVWRDGLKRWNMIKSKVVMEWTAEARQEGRQEGRQEAQVEERRENLRRVLLTRFTALPPDIEERVAAAAAAPLQGAFTTAVLGTLDEVRAKL